MSSMELSVMIVLVVSILPCMGLLTAITPWLMKGRECFAVTVPESAQKDERLRGFKMRYTAFVTGATVVFLALDVLALAWGAMDAVLVIMIVGSMVLLALSFCLMQYYRRKVALIKQAEGWVAVAQESVAMPFEGDMPRPLSLKWNLVYLPIMLITLVVGFVGYPSMPDMVPMRVDFEGNVTQWVPKSLAVIFFPIIIQLFMAACFAFSHWSILRSKKGSDPEKPVASALAYALFARAQSVFLVAAGALISAAIIFMQLSSLGLVTLGQAALALFVVIVPILVGTIAISIIYGQSGARAIKRVEAAGELRFDDDEHWKLGLFYWNAEDSSLFVPERFGIGWTLNLGRPSAWAIIVGGAVVTILFMAVVLALF